MIPMIAIHETQVSVHSTWQRPNEKYLNTPIVPQASPPPKKKTRMLFLLKQKPADQLFNQYMMKSYL